MSNHQHVAVTAVEADLPPFPAGEMTAGVVDVDGSDIVAVAVIMDVPGDEGGTPPEL